MCRVSISVLLIVLCSMVETRSGIELTHNKSIQESSPVAKADLSRWQTVSLSGKGIEFRLPLDWQHDTPDLEHRTDYLTTEQVSWTSANKDLIRITVTTVIKGFVSLQGVPASKEQIVEQEFNIATVRPDPSFTQVKKFKLSGIDGVFKMLRVDFKEDIGIRTGPVWRGFRIYRGKAQDIEIQLSSNPQRGDLLQTIFNAIKIEQDKGTGKP
jgi:hypothetical protein